MNEYQTKEYKVELLKQLIVAKHVLKTLNDLVGFESFARGFMDEIEASITSISKEIAELEKQEPVVWLCEPDENGLYGLPLTEGTCTKCFPVYRHPQSPQPRKPLTWDEINQVFDKAGVTTLTDSYGPHELEIARAIEQAHGISDVSEGS
jgi:hypothetical protein